MGYKLTARGETVAFHANALKGPEDAVLVYLYEHRPTPIEIEELVGELNSTEIKILHVINGMLNEANPKVQEV